MLCSRAKTKDGWTNDYRLRNCSFDMPITLLIDSHNSRINYEAMDLFSKKNTRVITFPPHCTHVMQPFDVAIARQIKAEYTRLYKCH